MTPYCNNGLSFFLIFGTFPSSNNSTIRPRDPRTKIGWAGKIREIGYLWIPDSTGKISDLLV